jgi:hypothetical protein
MNKPRWSARDERDRKQMHDWVCERLDDPKEGFNLIRYGLTKRPELTRPTIEEVEDEEQWRKAEARLGNVEPLRRAHPDLAEFLFSPKRKRGQKLPPRWVGPEDVWLAAVDAKFIPMIWKKYYRRSRRTREDGPSAVDIAARKWGVAKNRVEARIKKLRARFLAWPTAPRGVTRARG